MKVNQLIPNRLRTRGFTMVEILTAVAITTLIVFALVSMFNTSTKALLMGIKQKDVWEAARASFGMVSTDVEKVTFGQYANVNVNANLRISLATFGPNEFSSSYTLPDGTVINNQLQDFYLLSRDGTRWELDVYRIVREGPGIGVGSLYRFHTNYSTYDAVVGDNPAIDFTPFSPLASDSVNPANWPDNVFVDQASRMADGVVHMRLVAYDNDGRALYPTNAVEYDVSQFSFAFGGETLPAAVDLEMFVIEPDRINEFRAQSGPIAKEIYLKNHIGSVQMFRTRIPIRKDAPKLQ